MLARQTRTQDVAGAITALLLESANSYAPGPAKNEAALARLKGKIARAVDCGAVLELVLPAFPAKSPNPEKILGALPDYGEVLALSRLETLCRKIRALHAPGARLVICSDGRAFSDLVRVNDEDVNAYGRGIEKILGDWGLASLTTFNLDDVFNGLEFSRMRRELVGSYGTPVDEIRRRTREDNERKSLFNGIHRFLFEDRIVLEPEKSRNRVREETKAVAYEVIQRSNAWSALVEEKFPEAVRLSIHPQGADSDKLGVKLLPSRNIWRTPWHGVAVGDGEHFELTTRRAAEEAGAKLVRSEGGYGYFETSSSRWGFA